MLIFVKERDAIRKSKERRTKEQSSDASQSGVVGSLRSRVLFQDELVDDNPIVQEDTEIDRILNRDRNPSEK